MFFSKSLIALVATSCLHEVIALSPRHVHMHLNEKRGYVTEYTTVTNIVTVTVDAEAAALAPQATRSYRFRKNGKNGKKGSSSSSPVEVAAAPTDEAVAAPTDEAVATDEVFDAARVRPTEVPAPVAPQAPSPAEPASPVVPETPVETNIAVPATGGGSSTGGGGSAPSGAHGRGLAYNDASLLARFLGSGTKISWTYNWAQTGENKAGLEFVPMMWSTGKGFPSTWEANAKKMIAAGSKALFSFNEPDHHEQANMSPSDAAAAHKQYMNPFQGQALIGTPSVTNGGGAMGLNWLKNWFDACGGGCAADFVNIHIYNVDTNTFLNHLLQAKQMFNKPVWITEFGFNGNEAEINRQLSVVIDQIETNSTFSFVERYAYFMAAEGIMVKGNSMSTYGNTFAYANAA